MEYKEFLERIILDGMEAVKRDYAGDVQKNKREGALAGFEACMGLEPLELVDMFHTATKYMTNAMRDTKDSYWYFRCYQMEVEWVINVVSAMLLNQGAPALLSHLPTSRGLFKAAEILGVKAQ